MDFGENFNSLKSTITKHNYLIINHFNQSATDLRKSVTYKAADFCL